MAIALVVFKQPSGVVTQGGCKRTVCERGAGQRRGLSGQHQGVRVRRHAPRPRADPSHRAHRHCPHGRRHRGLASRADRRLRGRDRGRGVAPGGADPGQPPGLHPTGRLSRSRTRSAHSAPRSRMSRPEQRQPGELRPHCRHRAPTADQGGVMLTGNLTDRLTKVLRRARDRLGARSSPPASKVRQLSAQWTGPGLRPISRCRSGRTSCFTFTA